MRLRYVALLITMTACAGVERQSSALTLARYALDELKDVRSADVLDNWVTAHPSDSIELYAPSRDDEMNSEWCARAVAHVVLDAGGTARRVAYFYPPASPAEPRTVSSKPPDELRGQCQLGAAWITSLESDSVRTERLADITRAALVAKLGAADTTTQLFWGGAAFWRHYSLWKSGTTQVASAASGAIFDHPGDSQPGPPRVLIAIAGHASHVSFEFPSIDPDCSTPTTPRCAPFARLEEAIALADIGGETERTLRAIAQREERLFYSDTAASPDDRRAFTNALRDWVGASRTLPAARRAAGLVAADLFLDEVARRVAAGEPDTATAAAMRAALDTLGATFVYSPLGAAHVYTRSWMREAMDLDTGDRAYELASQALMEIGFETGICGAGPEGFRAVIAHGTAFLARFPNSGIAREMHVLVARAHGDVVTLANGGVYDYADSSQYIAEAPTARASAVEHYSAALAIPGGTAAERREIWSSAWRLVAGLSPMHTYFYCVYD